MSMTAQSPNPTRRLRPDGSVEYRCPACQKLLVVGKYQGWVQGFCTRCKRERRFTER
jgi:hypothetical protein